MPRDYAKPNRPRPRQRNSRVSPSRKSTPGWIWFLAGILVGALATGIFHYSQERKADGTLKLADAAREKEIEAAPTHKPRFDFYTLLKETEVIVPEEDNPSLPRNSNIAKTVKELTLNEEELPKPSPNRTEPETSREPRPVEKPAAEYRTVYVLQAGSFKNASDADSVRARLLLLNLQASIEKVTTNNNETWHRVLIGPFNDKAESSKARAALTRNGIDSIQLKRRL